MPTVGVAQARRRGEVRSVAEQPVEPAGAAREVGPHDLEGQSFGERQLPESNEGVGVDVGSDHPGPSAGRREGDASVPSAHFDDALTHVHGCERQEELGVLPGRVDRPAPVLPAGWNVGG
jgi:hypothetical protein